MGKHPNPKPQTTRIQDPTKLLVGEGERGKQRSQDPQMGTSLAPPPQNGSRNGLKAPQTASKEDVAGKK